MKPIDLAQLKLAVDVIRAKAQSPRIIQTQQEADKINKLERPFGLNLDWKVGDTYYLLSDFR